MFERPKKRFIMGLAGAMVYHCKGSAALKKMLLLQDNDYLISTLDMTAGCVKYFLDVVAAIGFGSIPVVSPCLKRKRSWAPITRGRIPLKYLGQDMIVFGFTDARARTFLYEK